jgi:serine/threonine protein phosphatase PrpC
MDGLASTFLDIHSRILGEARRRGFFGMGTTLAAAKLVNVPEHPETENGRLRNEKRFITANVGDSPILLVKRKDGSEVECFHDDSERARNPSNMWSVVQYLGYEEGAPKVHSRQVEYETGDILLLCSDGITDNLVLAGRSYELLAKMALRTRSAKRIVQSALSSRIKRDDMTVVLVFL